MPLDSNLPHMSNYNPADLSYHHYLRAIPTEGTLFASPVPVLFCDRRFPIFLFAYSFLSMSWANLLSEDINVYSSRPGSLITVGGFVANNAASSTSDFVVGQNTGFWNLLAGY